MKIITTNNTWPGGVGPYGISPKQPLNDLIERTIMARQEIAQLFLDVEHWNCVRKPDEQPIDPDPDGDLRRIAAEYDDFLKSRIS